MQTSDLNYFLVTYSGVQIVEQCHVWKASPRESGMNIGVISIVLGAGSVLDVLDDWCAEKSIISQKVTQNS